MKKVGVLTYHRSINYGAFLQAYALVSHLGKTINADVELIDYESSRSNRQYKLNILLGKDDFLGIYKRMAMYLAFKKSLKKMPMSKETIITDDYKAVFKQIKNKYDIIIVGSDVVWNWNLRGFPNAYLLNEDLGCVKMSYAASANGMNFGKVTSEQRNYIHETLKHFTYIGVRDNETKNFIQSIDNSFEIHQNCDPTILLDIDKNREELKISLSKRYKIDFNRPAIGIMTGNRTLGKFVKDKYGSKYQIVSLYVNNPYSDVFLYDINPFEWAQVFSHFRILFTQYFHGMVFSFKNKVPAIVVDSWYKNGAYVSKTKDFMLRNGIDDCYFTANELSREKWDQISKLADNLIENPPVQKINNMLESEKRYFDSFLGYIKKCI